MKRIFFFSLFLILSFNLFAQTPTWVDTSKARADKYRIAGNNNPFPVQILTPLQFPANGFSTGQYKIATKTDTLSGASDTVTFDFNNEFAYGYITIRDTTGASAKVDSVIIEAYHPLLAAWSSQAIGLKDISTSAIVSGACVVPANGLIKMYLLNYLYPGKVRVRWYYGADKASRAVPLIFRGNN